MNNEAIKKIAENNGFDEASRQLMEEVGELIVALNKYYRNEKENLKAEVVDWEKVADLEINIAEEIADVTIMLFQIKYLLQISETDIEQIIEQKLNRQLERIGADERKS